MVSGVLPCPQAILGGPRPSVYPNPAILALAGASPPGPSLSSGGLYLPDTAGAQPVRTERYRGVQHSIDVMTKQAAGPRGDLSPLVRFVAEDICRYVAPKDYLSEILAVRYWVLQKAPYFNDPARVEWIRDPVAILEQIKAYGVCRCDCDEINELMAALWMACGKRVQFITAAFTPTGPDTHVFVRCEIPGRPRGKEQWIVGDPVAGTRETTMLTKVKRFTAYDVG